MKYLVKIHITEGAVLIYKCTVNVPVLPGKNV